MEGIISFEQRMEERASIETANDAFVEEIMELEQRARSRARMADLKIEPKGVGTHDGVYVGHTDGQVPPCRHQAPKDEVFTGEFSPPRPRETRGGYKPNNDEKVRRNGRSQDEGGDSDISTLTSDSSGGIQAS